MANFGDNDVDPAADFLAREQAELGGLDEDFKLPVSSVNDGAAVDVLKENSGSSFEMIDGLDQELLDAPKESNNVSPSITQKPEVREEPEKIRKWREDQIKHLKEKDIAEEKKKEEWREIAKKELEDWYKNHEETIAKTKAANRTAEKQFVADDDDIEPGTEWERIAKLCDFNPKAKQGSKDVSRMRSIILQMKQSPLPMTKV